MPGYVEINGFGRGGSTTPRTPYEIPVYKAEPVKVVATKCGACGSTAVRHTDKQCAANQKKKSN